MRKADGKDDVVSAAYMMQRIELMGSNRPRGLYAPKGVDVSTLPEEAVAALPPTEGKFVKSIVGLLRALAAVAPWRADVALIDGATATVDLRRNGWQVDSTLIFLDELGIHPDLRKTAFPQEVLTAASAFVLLRISDTHLNLKRGLCGTRHWRSLACQVLSATPPWAGDSAVSRRLLAKAVDKDPRNSAARLGYLVCRYGSMAETLEDQSRYIGRLEQFRDTVENPEDEDDLKGIGYLPLRVRTLLTLITARINYAAQRRSGFDDLNMESDARNDREKLEKALNELRTEKEKSVRLAPFYEEVEPNSRILIVHLNKMLGESQEFNSLKEGETSLLCSYNLACLDMADAAIGAVLDRALNRLDFAFGDTKYRKAALTDPVLQPLRDNRRSELMALLGKPRLSDLEVLQPHVAPLERDGIRYPGELIARTADDTQVKELATALKVPKATVEWIREVCQLVESCPDQQQALAWTNLLTREGLDGQQALRSLDEAETQRLEKLAWTADAVPLTPGILAIWANSTR
ncbi:hypothetical protein [Streptomyces sp. NPDC017202]|uniref:hypothetical protein n=1 Tax=Streptomyces sp. NPDC017202 TaxID=3364981 RepID=UPI0037951BC5